MVALKLSTFTLAAVGGSCAVLVASHVGGHGAGTARGAPDLHHGRGRGRDVHGRRDRQPRGGDVGEAPVVEGDPPLHLAVIVLGGDDLALPFVFCH